MKNIVIFCLAFLFSINNYAQVGISNTDPKASLDISATSISTPNPNDGLLIPRINKFPATNPNGDQNSMIVYLNNDLTATNINGTTMDYDLGFYYWDNSQTDWIRLLASVEAGWLITGNADIDDTVNFLGTTTNDNVVFKRNNIFSGILDDSNTAFGVNSLESNSSGINNTALGVDALKNTLGGRNTAIGYRAGDYNINGDILRMRWTNMSQIIIVAT